MSKRKRKKQAQAVDEKSFIRPRYLQYWKSNKSGLKKRIGAVSARFNVKWDDESGSITYSHLNKFWTFIPNSNIEWLAINAIPWNDDERALVCKDGESFRFKTRFEQKPTDSDWYSKQEWQLKRYYLGLDVKPHYVFRMDEWVLGVRE